MPKLGKKPARPGAVRFALTDYLPAADLPDPPAVFGHQGLVPVDWGVLGNDAYGDCVWAGADHEHMLWNKEAGSTVTFSDSTALGDYAAATGFDPTDPGSDQGSDMEESARYRRHTGVVDVAGVRHVVDAYVALPGIRARGNNDITMLDGLAAAAYLFGAVGVGIEFPDSAMTQFNDGAAWDVVSGSKIEGGHYVPLVGRNERGNFLVITWGQVQEVTPAFLLKYVDEAIAYLSVEFLTNNTSLEGFDVTKLQTDLAALGGGAVPVPAPAPGPTPDPSPTPTPAFPLGQVKPWLDCNHVGKARVAQKAIQAWLAAGGNDSQEGEQRG